MASKATSSGVSVPLRAVEVLTRTATGLGRLIRRTRELAERVVPPFGGTSESAKPTPSDQPAISQANNAPEAAVSTVQVRGKAQSENVAAPPAKRAASKKAATPVKKAAAKKSPTTKAAAGKAAGRRETSDAPTKVSEPAKKTNMKAAAKKSAAKKAAPSQKSTSKATPPQDPPRKAAKASKAGSARKSPSPSKNVSNSRQTGGSPTATGI